MEMENRKKSIDKIFKRRDRIEMPELQREEVWPIEKKQLLIDTILRGWHLPKFYFRKLDDGTFECIDGQQRLVAIYEFFEDHLDLSKDTAEFVNAKIYSKLPENISDRFDDYEIDIEEIDNATDKELETLFLRLQLGTPLNTAEKLNAIMGGLRAFCKKASINPFFKKKIILKDNRYSHFEIAVRWAYVEAKGITTQTRFAQLESFMQENRTFSEKSATAKTIVDSLKYLNEAFPDRCAYLRNKANILSVCMLASRVILHNLHKGTQKSFGNFINDFYEKLAAEIEKGVNSTDKEILRYQQAIISGSASQESISTRISILTKSLATNSPDFAPLIGIYPDVMSEAQKDIIEQASILRNLIYNINSRYSSANGEDLFKMTNETVLILNNMANPCSNIEIYGELIDGLYHLVYEGSGNCQRLPQPPNDFVMDIKMLRTGLRHDTGHGKRSDITRKKIAIGKVMKKYSEKSSPDLLSPEEFISFHGKILRALITFLKSLE